MDQFFSQTDRLDAELIEKEVEFLRRTSFGKAGTSSDNLMRNPSLSTNATMTSSLANSERGLGDTQLRGIQGLEDFDDFDLRKIQDDMEKSCLAILDSMKKENDLLEDIQKRELEVFRKAHECKLVQGKLDRLKGNMEFVERNWQKQSSTEEAEEAKESEKAMGLL